MSWFSKKDKLQKKIEKEMAKVEAKSASKLPPIESRAVSYAVPEEMFRRLDATDFR